MRRYISRALTSPSSLPFFLPFPPTLLSSFCPRRRTDLHEHSQEAPEQAIPGGA